MNYRSDTPQIISIIRRKLKAGKTFEDFQKAHCPPGKRVSSTVGQDVNYFKTPTRVINAISPTDPNVIMSIGMTYGDPKEIFKEVKDKLPSERARAKQIDAVAEKTGATEVFVVQSDNNYGGANPNFTSKPIVDDIEVIATLIAGLKKA